MLCPACLGSSSLPAGMLLLLVCRYASVHMHVLRNAHMQICARMNTHVCTCGSTHMRMHLHACMSPC